MGTGVTYCQGDLSDTDSLKYAETDVDKIIFCAAAPRPDDVITSSSNGQEEEVSSTLPLQDSSS
jgi:hypothetical protein